MNETQKEPEIKKSTFDKYLMFPIAVFEELYVISIFQIGIQNFIRFLTTAAIPKDHFITENDLGTKSSLP